jgi:hypothetical protein
LKRRSKLVPPIELVAFGYPQEEINNPVRIFEGFSKAVGDKLGFSQHQRSRALQILNSMNCITRIKTPGGGSAGVWILHYEPSQQQFLDHKETNLKLLRINVPSKTALIIEQMRSLTREMTNIRKEMEETRKVLGLRISQLEKQIGHIRGESPSVSEM